MIGPLRDDALLRAIALAGRHGGAYLLSAAQLRARVAAVLEMARTYLFPIKTNPDPGVLAIAVEQGAGLDLCSRGDLDLARSYFRAGLRLSFTSPNLDRELAADLVAAGVSIDLDSWQQVDLLPDGTTGAGLRICTADADSAYGSKFGVPACDVAAVAEAVRTRGTRLNALHLHTAHRTADEMPERILSLLEPIEPPLLAAFDRINLGGGWPLAHGIPVPSHTISRAILRIRETLAARGFSGDLEVEPGEWVVGPCAWLAARVSAVKAHPIHSDRRIVILDTATPVPCRARDGPVHLVRGGAWMEEGGPAALCDVYGSANTGLDTLCVGVTMPLPRAGDLAVIPGQGAYARQLTGSFNERPLPPLMLFD